MSQVARFPRARNFTYLVVLSLSMLSWNLASAVETSQVLAYAVDGPLAVGEAAPVAISSPQEVFVGQPPAPLAVGSHPAAAPSVAAHEETGTLALQQISYAWRQQLPGWTIDFGPARVQLRGLTVASERRIEIYIHTQNVDVVARVIAHELGHAADLTYNNTGSRRQWETARHLNDDVPWWPTAGYPDFSTGSGDFAECFATWQVGSASRSGFGVCSGSDLDLVAAIVGQ